MINKEKLKTNFSTCSGPSMYPTLKNGDGIVIEPYSDKEDIEVGDIIVYPHPKKDFDIVHRVIKKISKGVITRGDNNNKVDFYVVLFKNITGKVTLVKRNGKQYHKYNGKSGYRIHRLMIFRKFLFYYILKPLRILSKNIEKTKFLNLFHPLFKTKQIQINKKGQDELLLVYRNKVIGRKKINRNWIIKFPYKFFINKEKIK